MTFATILKRIGFGIIVVVTVIILLSALLFHAPVDPARLTFGQRADVSTVEAKRAALGLDLPVPLRIWKYLGDISPVAFAHERHVSSELFRIGPLVIKNPNLKESYQTGRPVIDHLADALPNTFLLAIAAFIFAACVGILFGVIAALGYDTWVDRLLLAFTTLGISVPSYVSAIIFALLFGYLWHDWTGLNVQGSLVELNDLGDPIVVWKNLILPALALGVRPIAVITQLTRSAVLDVIRQDYVRTAKSKGLEAIYIVRKHVLSNAWNPIITGLTGWLASLLAGAFFVERIYNFKGLGDLTITALTNYDITLLLGCMITVCILFVTINLLTDILYQVVSNRRSG